MCVNSASTVLRGAWCQQLSDYFLITWSAGLLDHFDTFGGSSLWVIADIVSVTNIDQTNKENFASDSSNFNYNFSDCIRERGQCFGTES